MQGKLAFRNVKRSVKDYLVYLLTMTFVTALMFAFNTVLFSKDIQQSSESAGIMAAIMNYFVLLPMYQIFMPIDQVIASFAEVIPFIHTKLDVVLYSALPGNILKGLIVSVITMLVYKRVSPAMKGMR